MIKRALWFLWWLPTLALTGLACSSSAGETDGGADADQPPEADVEVDVEVDADRAEGPDADADSDADEELEPDAEADEDPEEPPPPFVLRAPAGALAFLSDAEGCPEGWRLVEEASGRAILAVAEGSDVGHTSGLALVSGQALTHSHDYVTEVSLPSAGVAGASGCCNESTAQSGSYDVVGFTGPSEDDLPRVEQPLCERREGAEGPGDGHPFPAGAILFFNRERCPEGWTALARADGRFIVATPEGGEPGLAQGTPLLDGALPEHSHRYRVSLDVEECSLAALGGSNDGPALRGSYPIEGVTTAATATPPYIQFLACRAEVQEPPPEREIDDEGIPEGALAFFQSEECPEGWSASETHRGRFVFALSEGGTPMTTSGGTPLTPGERRSHRHSIEFTLSIPSHRMALASGCCYNQTGCSGDFLFSLLTDPSEVELPTLSLTACVVVSD